VFFRAKIWLSLAVTPFVDQHGHMGTVHIAPCHGLIEHTVQRGIVGVQRTGLWQIAHLVFAPLRELLQLFLGDAGDEAIAEIGDEVSFQHNLEGRLPCPAVAALYKAHITVE